LAEGHALGSHSLSHPAPGRLGALALQRDVRAGRRALEEVSGRPVRLYRPPHGHLPWAAVAAARAAAVRPWLWSCDSEDWRPDATADEIVEAATTLVARDVVLLHDALHSPDPSASTDRSATVEALPRIIEVLRARGLDFAPLRTTEPG
jgi:peptidoglycan/xylan/chitin deacetylase (PgdA/CDA1 family)